MSFNLNLRLNGLNNSLREKSVQVFSLRGAHLIAMFARTPVAEDFRKWVLDLFDKETKPMIKRRGTYAKQNADLPCGVYHHQSKYNPYRTCVWDGKTSLHIGSYPTVNDAVAAIEHFNHTRVVRRLQRSRLAPHIKVTTLPVLPMEYLSTNAAVSADGTHLIATSDMVDHFAVSLEATQLLTCYKHGKDLAWELVAFIQETAKGSSLH